MNLLLIASIKIFSTTIILLASSCIVVGALSFRATVNAEPKRSSTLLICSLSGRVWHVSLFLTRSSTLEAAALKSSNLNVGSLISGVFGAFATAVASLGNSILARSSAGRGSTPLS